MTRPRRGRGEAGQVGGIEAVPFGLLVLVVGVLLLAHAWAVVDAKFVTTSAAREATRAFVEAPSEAQGAIDASGAGADAASMSLADVEAAIEKYLRREDPPSYFGLRTLNGAKGGRVRSHRHEVYRFLIHHFTSF